VRVFLAAVVAFLFFSAPARAAAPDFGSVAVAGGYVLPIGCSAITGTYHLTYIVYGEGAPQRWRTAAYVCGGVAIGVGTYVLVDSGGETTGAKVLGGLPIVVGSYAILTALFVGPEQVIGPQARVTPWFGPHGGGLVWSGTF
jgi:hypothetical protein